MPAPSTLIPGFRQVETFGPDEDYEGEEEITYVPLDLGASLEPTLVASSSTYRLIVRSIPDHPALHSTQMALKRD